MVKKNLLHKKTPLKRHHVGYSIAAFVSLATLLIYLPALRNGFINWDDTVYVYENPHIRSLNWEFFKWAFSDLSAQFWHPVTWISYAVDYALWGMNPVGYHLTAILLHAINTFLVVYMIVRLLESIKRVRIASEPMSFLDERGILITASVTGLLFGLHPLHVESVAWVSERKDLLCALFFLLSIIAYTNYYESILKLTGKWYLNRQYLLSFAFFILALASKTMAVSLPLVLLILDWYPLKRIRSVKDFTASFIEKIPFISASLLISIVSIIAQKSLGALRMMDPQPLPVRILMAFKALMLYLSKMVIPVHLVPFYPYSQNVSLLSLEYLSAMALVAGITAVCIFMAKKQRVWLALWAYYVITLLPTLGIVQVGAHSTADRFTYLPSLGPFLLCGLGASWVWTKTDGRLIVRRFISVAAILIVIFLSYLTLKQLAIWKDSIVFWNYVIEKEPRHNAMAYNNRGWALRDIGAFDRAIADFSEAITNDPQYGEAYFNRGLTFADQGRLDLAVENFNSALGLRPIPEAAWKVYSNRGIALVEKGEFDNALKDFNTAVGIKPVSAQSYVNRGMALQKMGQLDHALEDFTTALNLDPDVDAACKAYSDRGAVFYEKRQVDRALDDFNRVLALYPECAEGYNNRGVAFEDMGQLDRAIEDYSKALSLNPGLTGLYIARGGLYMKKGLTDLAVKDYQKACELGIKEGCDAVSMFNKP